MAGIADIPHAGHSKKQSAPLSLLDNILCYRWVSLRDRIAYDRACNTIRTN